MGEGFGAWTMGDDAELLDHVTSANIACGFHAGDPGTIHRTVKLALDKGVAVGAHPSNPDLLRVYDMWFDYRTTAVYLRRAKR